jgi:hypothetical protein
MASKQEQYQAQPGGGSEYQRVPSSIRISLGDQPEATMMSDVPGHRFYELGDSALLCLSKDPRF